MKQNFNSKELVKYLKKGELIRNELEKEDVIIDINDIESKILQETFEFNILDSHEYYHVKDLSEKLILRKLNDNIKRIYKDEQANRKFIIQQVKTLLNENAPFWIIKTDIKSFYESIDRNKILKKIKDDAMLSYYSIHLLKKIFDNELISNHSGLPRGLNISSTLSEIYLRKFDKWVNNFSGVYFYARFVDDIIIFLSNKENANDLYNSLETNLMEICSLEINEDKTELIDGSTFKIIFKKNTKKFLHNNIEYLGYKFYLESSSKNNKTVKISIADKKVKKIKTRITRSFLDFVKNKDFNLLDKRIKFLTGNYGIRKNNDGSVLKAGIFYNYTHLDNEEILIELNKYLRKIIFSQNRSFGNKLYPLLNNAQRDILKKYCFKTGFKKKTYNSFSFKTMREIIKCW
jgi:hypothetical protein